MIKWGLLWTKANESFRQGTHPVNSQKDEMLASIATADWAPEMGAFWGSGPLLSRTAALMDGILLQQVPFYSYQSRQGLTSYWEHLGRSQYVGRYKVSTHRQKYGITWGRLQILSDPIGTIALPSQHPMEQVHWVVGFDLPQPIMQHTTLSYQNRNLTQETQW